VAFGFLAELCFFLKLLLGSFPSAFLGFELGFKLFVLFVGGDISI
jgi:hypothetical protein